MSTEVEFADDQISRTILVPLLNDTLKEPNETFTLTLSAATNGAFLGTSSASVLILEPDTTDPKVTLRDPKANLRINEGAVTASGEVSDKPTGAAGAGEAETTAALLMLSSRQETGA